MTDMPNGGIIFLSKLEVVPYQLVPITWLQQKNEKRKKNKKAINTTSSNGRAKENKRRKNPKFSLYVPYIPRTLHYVLLGISVLPERL